MIAIKNVDFSYTEEKNTEVFKILRLISLRENVCFSAEKADVETRRLPS